MFFIVCYMTVIDSFILFQGKNAPVMSLRFIQTHGGWLVLLRSLFTSTGELVEYNGTRTFKKYAHDSVFKGFNWQNYVQC